MASIIQGRHHYYFINNVIGQFVKGTGDFLRTELFPRTTELVIGTYEKALQHYQNELDKTGHKHHPKFPFITLDPSLELEPEERAGRFLHQYPSFEPKFAAKHWEPVVYLDNNVRISPILNRYKGRFEVILWCSSVYEALDYRILAYQFFGGLDRPIYPKNIEGYFILPDEVSGFNYTNRYTGEDYPLDWENNSGVGVTLIKNINQDKHVFPFAITPWLKLTGVSDGSEKYGGDALSDWRVVLELEWETYLPTHMVLEAHEEPVVRDSIFEISVGFHYVQANQGAAPEERIIHIASLDSTSSEIVTGVDGTSGEPIFAEFSSSHATAHKSVDASFDEEYNYIITASDGTSLLAEENIIIELQRALPKPHLIKLFTKNGEIARDYKWRTVNGKPKQIELIGFAVGEINEEDVISIILYKNDDE
ncbi:MAG: hypothetical protein KAS32_14155 [Candidatus Peribacteraceae bacterium]|nr:hypothetical protein [Candidatus Peribacteraceae bacterium]